VDSKRIDLTTFTLNGDHAESFGILPAEFTHTFAYAESGR
jgi:high-affinity K+ transport system ATPase subunit B